MKGTIHTVVGFPGGVDIANAEDSYYSYIFETAEELEMFIRELKDFIKTLEDAHANKLHMFGS